MDHLPQVGQEGAPDKLIVKIYREATVLVE
jgi:hypothetical protein